MSPHREPGRPTMDARNLADDYDLPIVDWTTITARLAQEITQAPDTGGPGRHTCWLTTTDADGAPHVTGVGAWWARDAWWFQSRLDRRKARNLARDPRCALALAVHEFDLVVKGAAEVVTDPETVAWFAARAAEDGWSARVDESGTALTAEFNAASAGPPPWHVHRITPSAATAILTVGAGGATRWRF